MVPGATHLFAQKKKEAEAARDRAASAQKQADAASVGVRRYAAAVYQQNGSLGDLEGPF